MCPGIAPTARGVGTAVFVGVALEAVPAVAAPAAYAALLLCNQSVQLHGAIGFTDEYELGIYLNRALNLSAWLGNAAEHRRRWGALADAAGAGTA